MENKKKFIVNFLFYGIIFICVYLVFKHILPVMTPFIMAFLIAYLLRKPIKNIQNKLQINRKAVSVFMLIVLYGLLTILLLTAVISGVSFIQNSIEQIPAWYSGTVEPLMDSIYQELIAWDAQMTPALKETVLEIIKSAFEQLKMLASYLTNGLIKGASSLIKFIPSFFISFVIMIVSSFFITIDFEKMGDYIENNLSVKTKNCLNEIKDFVSNKLWVIIKSYVKIMSLTFVELSIGFLLMKFDNPFTFALIIAVFDILPIFGTGGIMIPWLIIEFIVGNTLAGVELLVLYIVITIVRNIVEPKLVGANLGLHPVITLICMIVGTKLFGFVGLFGLPIFASFLIYQKSLHSAN